jgi:hypothetical protein
MASLSPSEIDVMTKTPPPSDEGQPPVANSDATQVDAGQAVSESGEEMILSHSVAQDFLDWRENQNRSPRHKFGVDLGLIAMYSVLTAALIVLAKWCMR